MPLYATYVRCSPLKCMGNPIPHHTQNHRDIRVHRGSLPLVQTDRGRAFFLAKSSPWQPWGMKVRTARLNLNQSRPLGGFACNAGPHKSSNAGSHNPSIDLWPVTSQCRWASSCCVVCVLLATSLPFFRESGEGEARVPRPNPVCD